MYKNHDVITNLRIYDLFESMVASGYSMIDDYEVGCVNNAISDLEYCANVENNIFPTNSAKRALQLLK